MTYDAKERSRQQGQPIQLFMFRYGEGTDAVYCYTDAEDSQTFDGREYTPIAIVRGAITSSGTLDKAKLELRLDGNTDIGILYKNYPPSFVVTLIIRAHHIGDTEYPVVWSGIVRGGGPAESEIVLTCEPISTQMKRNGLRRNYQYGCPHVLYGVNCRADKALATYTGVVASMTTSTVTLVAGWNGAIAVTKFAAGMLSWLNDLGNLELRTINSVIGDTINVKGALRDIHVGMSVDAILGCDHTVEDCENLHREILTGLSNINNYGGQPWIPSENPVLKNQSF